jgi:hypothetical protein
VMQFSTPTPGALSPWDSVLGAIEDSISQCTFLQMTYTAENLHSDDSTSIRTRDPHDTSPAPTTTGWREDRCPVVSKRPLHSCCAAKMSPHIHINLETVLTVHVPSRPAAGSCHCQARKDSARHCQTEFSSSSSIQDFMI